MLIRISLIIAIVGGLAVGALNFVKIGKTITVLRTDLASEKSQKEKAQADLASTRRELEKTSTDLRHTKETLTATIAEKDTAVAAASAASKRATELSDKLNKTVEERDDARANLEAYRVSGLSSAQVMNLGKQLKQTEENLTGAQEENKLLGNKIAKLEFELDKYRGKIPIVFLPATLEGRILVSDPKWDFVVLSVGEDQGVKVDGELLVSRAGKLVAKVIVRNIQKDRCIANVMPGWKLGELMEGDQVIPAHPAS
jgi:flagellar biosynthesis chaperone FliJ